jgi:hypothetical protein
VDPENELKPYHDRYEDLDVNEPSTWKAATVSCLTKLKRPNLAIVAVIAALAIAAYKNPPTCLSLAAIVAVAVIGVAGGSCKD